jgi:hypothetical protein
VWQGRAGRLPYRAGVLVRQAQGGLAVRHRPGVRRTPTTCSPGSTGGGQELYDELVQESWLNVVGFFAMPMPTQPFGWFKKPITERRRCKGLKYRTVGLAADLMQAMGMP